MGRRRGTGVLLYVHEILPAGVKGRVAGALIRAATDAVFTNSSASVSALRRAGVTASVAPYGIALPTVEPHRPGRPPGRPLVVGTLGTVSRRKGSDVFLAAAPERLLQARSDVAFRLVGPLADGPEQPWAAALVERAGQAGVAWSTTSDPFDELAGWDVLVLPTREEAFGLVLIEAMAMRLPVVASRVDGPRDIVARRTPGSSSRPRTSTASSRRSARSSTTRDVATRWARRAGPASRPSTRSNSRRTPWSRPTWTRRAAAASPAAADARRPRRGRRARRRSAPARGAARRSRTRARWGSPRHRRARPPRRGRRGSWSGSTARRRTANSADRR